MVKGNGSQSMRRGALGPAVSPLGRREIVQHFPNFISIFKSNNGFAGASTSSY